MNLSGMTLSGGFTFVQPPSSTEATAGWYAGGLNYPSVYSTINRITFATDTVNALTRGPLSLEVFYPVGTGTTTAGYFGGGYVLSPAAAAVSSIQRTTYATDTATASIRGPLSGSKYGMGATTDNTTYGWFSGGNIPGTGRVTTVDRIIYATDTATATARGPLVNAEGGGAGTGNSSYGYIAGGFDGSTLFTSVQRITYATDTATASLRGPLNYYHFRSSASTTSTYGWIAGNSGAGTTSYVERITYASDTNTASVRGPLSSVAYGGAASGDSTYGWFALGASGPTRISTITRITYATDTAVSTDRSNLSLARVGIAGTSGIQ
jgi:hypothetical protein